jgi:hypothetical protein
MKRIWLQVQDDKYKFFLELLNNLGFVKIEEDEKEEDTREEIIANLTQAFKDIKLYKEGKLKTTPVQEFLNEF